MPTYERIQRIGAGGFGEVWKGVRRDDGACVAIKYLVENDPESEDRFKREVRCLENLSHPNIVKILGKQLTTPPFFYVMPLYNESLFSAIPNLVGDHTRIRTIFSSTLNAVGFAHGEGVIHRDLKPENVLLNSDNDLAVNDFGLGRILDAQSTRLTQTGQAFGTFLYCAPEQLQDAKRADIRSDIYSLGRILYDLYVGIHLGPQDLTGIPFPIAAVIQKASLRNPEQRYQTVREMQLDFESTMVLLLGEIEGDSIDGLLEALKVPDNYVMSLGKLVKLLTIHADDGDIVHDALVKLTPSAFSDIERSSPELARHLAATFSEFIADQSWGFSYTDTLSNVCFRLFTESSDPTTRANLTRAVMLVGINHNRWAVMERFGVMLNSIKEDADAQQHWAVLHTFPSELDSLTAYVNRNRLHPILRALYPISST